MGSNVMKRDMPKALRKGSNMGVRAGAAHLFWGMLFFVTMDLIVITTVVRPIYEKHLGTYLRSIPDWRVGLLTWLLIVAGHLIFVVPHALKSGDPLGAALWGGLFGFVLYGVFTLTNLAVLRMWTPQVALLDLATGSLNCAVLAIFQFYLARKL